MNVLITNRVLVGQSGTEVVVRDLSLELKKQGHSPLVYSPVLGPLADEVRSNGIPVYTDVRQIHRAPDIIHGHHHPQTLTALLRFPNTPATFVCHDALAWHDDPLIFPRILRYVAVDHLCKRRFDIDPQIRPESVRVIFNAVDMSRFHPRAPLPEQPLHAAIFSNYASKRTQVPAVTKACQALGITLDVIGRDSGTAVSRPEVVLPKYDIVFAKARCALEAMAIGSAVILCDFGGLGPMVTAEKLPELRRLNCGRGTLTRPLDAELIVAEIRKYDPSDARVVSSRVREQTDLGRAVAEWIELYGEICSEYGGGDTDRTEEFTALVDYVVKWGYDARIEWEKRRIASYIGWPILGRCARWFLDRERIALRK